MLTARIQNGVAGGDGIGGGYGGCVNKKQSTKQTWKLAMRWANREIHFISGPGWEQKGCSFSRGKRAHQIEEAGRDSKQIINSFLSCYNWNQSKPFLWKRAENWISAVADRNDCHSPPNWMSFLKLHRERAGKAGKQRSTYGRYQYAHLPAGVPGTPLRFRSLFLPLLFFSVLLGCFPGAAITHLPSDRLNQRFLFLTSKSQCLFFIVLFFCQNGGDFAIIYSAQTRVWESALERPLQRALVGLSQLVQGRARLDWVEKWSCSSISRVQR